MDALRNRLKKNLARLRPWAEREGLEAWRLYDRDIPEHPWSFDLYGPRVLATEYETPVTRRLAPAAREEEIRRNLEALCEATGVTPDEVTVKSRARRSATVRGGARGEARHEFPVGERGHRFLVNLVDYDDTGLFLDHRETRRKVQGLADGKRVLNLFCYTGSFTVYAAAGGAAGSTSVDLSPTYLGWAERNLELNGLRSEAHRLVRGDVFEFLRSDQGRYDLAVLDPPTLSRSARGRSFDVQAAHAELINRTLDRLDPEGLLLFSTNFRRFELDGRSLRAGNVREITRETIPPDFRQDIHRCWEIRPK